MLLILSGCAISPLSIDKAQDQSLIVINNYYHQAVAAANQHSRQRWRHGRIGNMIINLAGEPNLGLCYHWQKLVHEGIKPALEITGWKTVGIATNEGTGREHHAVLVYDPDRNHLQELLQEPPAQSAFVLDPWPTGTAAVYGLSEWLHWPGQPRSHTRLTNISKNKEIEQYGT